MHEESLPSPDDNAPGHVCADGHDCPRTVDFDSDAPAAASRRAFLRATGLLGAGAGAAALGLGAAPVAAASSSAASPSGSQGSSDVYDITAIDTSAAGRWRPDSESPRFTVVVMPDTQYLFDQDRIHPAPLEASLRYVLDASASAGENVVFLAHLGDLTQNGLANEFAAIGEVFTMLDRKHAAYSVLAGNHDVGSGGDDQRGDTPYLDTFGPKRFTGSPTYRGASPDGYNSYHVFRAGGRDWMVLALDWRLSPAGFEWANSVLAAHPTLPTIVTTHEIAGADDNGVASLSGYGQQLWDGLINGNDQIFLTLNGHYWPPGATTLTNKAGHDVHVHITNYQNRYYGGAALGTWPGMLSDRVLPGCRAAPMSGAEVVASPQRQAVPCRTADGPVKTCVPVLAGPSAVRHPPGPLRRCHDRPTRPPTYRRRRQERLRRYISEAAAASGPPAARSAR